MLAIITAGWYTDLSHPILSLNGVMDNGTYGKALDFILIASDKKNSIAQVSIKIDQNVIFSKEYFKKNIIENISIDTTKINQGVHGLF